MTPIEEAIERSGGNEVVHPSDPRHPEYVAKYYPMTQENRSEAEKVVLKHCSDGYPVRELLPSQGYKDLVDSVATALSSAQEKGRKQGAEKRGVLNIDESKFLKQTIVGENGNCHSATIASLLGIPIEEAWNVDRDVPKGESWVQSLRAWLDIRGFVYLYVHANTGIVPSDWHLMSGKSPRGFQHSVIGFRGEPIFDPHPEGGFLTSVDGYELILPKGVPFLTNFVVANQQ